MTAILPSPIVKSQPSLRQAEASDPLQSVWVGASAGTGKTKVLIDRVLRLMLPRPSLPSSSATPPAKILCLTFTKTAAAEMSHRIYERLSDWSVKSDSALEKDLFDLMGVEPTAEIRQEARRLFARVLDTAGGLKIMTIHSFCQSVLKRFPIEAGLPPHFQLMDEQNAIEYLTRCLHDIIAATRKNPDTALAQAFHHLTLYLDASAMSELMQQIMAKRSQLNKILADHHDAEGQAQNSIQALYDLFNIDATTTEPSILAGAGDLTPDEERGLKQSLDALLQGSKTDLDKAQVIQPWLEQKDKRAELFDSYCQAFFTDKDEQRKNPATKSALKFYPDILEVLQNEAARLQTIKDKLKAVRFCKINAAVLTIAAEIVGRYARYKKQLDRLDYDDLIIHTCALLSEEKNVPWVLFKLDEGIDHILVDEAQDTSPSQWQVIGALSNEFFTGQGSRENTPRTLFVVGDGKQSIFSFQGADPYEFTKMQKFFGGKATAIQTGWEVFLEHSFRSTRAVLEVVDKVFNNQDIRQGVADRDVLHLPFREGQAGRVELWPLIQKAGREDPAPWQLPTDIDAGDNAASRLAGKIAATIKNWIDSKELLVSKNRPIRAGDILILVQSRGEFVTLLMRALKSADVPVAGIDRITLSEEIAVIDLLALAQFALLPRDDLTLACLLKSPLIGMTEEQLFTLCHGRDNSLWSAVKKQHPDLAAWLQKKIAKAGFVTPYEFFAETLALPCFADAVSGRRGFYGRLGTDIQDALDEFLNACLQYEQSHIPSLQKFVDWFLRGKTEIKREQDQGRQNQVRIMTVHASKGLQAPIVFLPDAVKKSYDHNKARVRLLWPSEKNPLLLWSPRKELTTPLYAELQQAAQARQAEEYRRLLYVAMTRAEDRLYICGHYATKKPSEDCWYNLVANNFPAASTQHDFIMQDETLALWRFDYAQTLAHEKDKSLPEQTAVTLEPLPPWAFHVAGDEPSPPVPLSPSRPQEDEPTVRSPLNPESMSPFKRGNIVHHLLEILPALPLPSREKALARYLARPALELSIHDQKIFAAEILTVLHHPEFAPIFGSGSRAEVPVVGMMNAQTILSGQMDRILVTDTDVLIIDYKTNRPPPVRVEDVAAVYLKQMASYKAVMQKIYPNHHIKCALLWTDIPLLMPLPPELIG
jgi:ATP-dependent helicase/nuclease subunit A